MHHDAQGALTLISTTSTFEDLPSRARMAVEQGDGKASNEIAVVLPDNVLFSANVVFLARSHLKRSSIPVSRQGVDDLSIKLGFTPSEIRHPDTSRAAVLLHTTTFHCITQLPFSTCASSNS